MSDRRQKNVEIFEDTRRFYNEEPFLRESIEKSIAATALYTGENERSLPDETRGGQVRVTKHRTFEAAVKLHEEYPGKRIAVLNFASATNPGGGVTRGASAQEESLCRCSTLYPVISTKELRKSFYEPNRQKNNLHEDTCIYTPDIVICKTDEDTPRRLDREQFITVDVISCAAPNLREKPSNIYNAEGGDVVGITPEKLYKLHLKRAKHIMHTAAFNKAEILVLGAFGCGAFRNDPKIVARAYGDALNEYQNRFDVIEFAIYCRESETANYDEFRKAMTRYLKI